MRVFISTTAKNWITEHPSENAAEAVQAVWETITNRNGVLEAGIVQEDGDTSETMRENATAAQEQKQRLVSEMQSRVGIPRGYCFEQHLFGFVFEVAGN